MNATDILIDLAERGLLPDFALRAGIRSLLKKRLGAQDSGSCELNQERLQTLIENISNGPIAPVPEKANQQHYEVPAELFSLMLGKHRKYSCCVFPEGQKIELDEAEKHALELTCRRAELQDGMRILELGCGWGSLTLWLARNYPNAEITAVSNSTSQREFILNQAEEQGIADRLTVLTEDMNEFDTDEPYDRIISVEMFEHMRNYALLMQRISNWLKPDGKLFVHIFCHREFAYEFIDEGSGDWMSRYFFTGGIMPSDGLLARFQDHLNLQKHWRLNGKHYQKTADAWLANMDQNRKAIMPVLSSTYGPQNAKRWFHRWRMFYLACSELFGFQNGQQWWVSHYLFENGARHENDIKQESTSRANLAQ